MGPAQCVDVAFHLRLNRWQGRETLQLDLRGLRASSSDQLMLLRQERQYFVRRDGDQLVIRNAAGEEVRSGTNDSGHHPYVRALFQEAAMALGMAA